MLRDFLRDEFQGKHLAAVAHIHPPSQQGDQRNVHAHIIGSTRTLGPEGFAAKKYITNDNYGPVLNRWREKWAELGGRYLEKAGQQVEADRVSA